MGWVAAGTVLAALIAIVAQFQPLFLEGSAKTDDAVKMGSGEMFDRVAPGYDLVNTVLTMKMDAAWRNEMITSLRLKPGQHIVMFDFVIARQRGSLASLSFSLRAKNRCAGANVLDVGTGTAEVALAIAHYMKNAFSMNELPDGSVLGVDPSEGMISVRAYTLENRLEAF